MRIADLQAMVGILSEILVRDTQIIFGDVYDLLREAMSCYQNGAFLAASIVCRSAVESALYVAVSRTLQIERVASISSESVAIDYQHRDARRRKIMELAKEKGLLKGNLAGRVRWVFDLGDFGAHFGQRLDKEIFGSNLEDLYPHRTWATRKEALKALKYTALILDALMKLVMVREHPSTEHPTVEDFLA
ncbi:MAG: hypothetical protein JRN59_05135 [Nitrososphaerota archaeon]|nr:hypothetical protein [Nitrososphaerota archaeon]